MGKWLSALKWLVVAVVLAVFIGLLIKWNRKGGISVEVGFDDRIKLTSQEIRRIEQIGQWEFLSVQSEVVADTLRKGFFTDDRLVAVYTGVPRIGIDMNRVTGEWAQAHGDTVTLRLPAVHLLDKNFIDEARTKVFYESGKWTAHATYGRQLEAEFLERLLPDSTAEIRAYLSSRAVRGVGPKTAEKIVAAFGTDSLKILETAPERLTEIDGISRKKALEIGASFRQQVAVRRLIEFLAGYRIPAQVAVRLYRVYGAQSLERVQEDPYLLAQPQFGAGFGAADQLALELGFDGDDARRVEAGVIFELRHNLTNGHTFLPQDKLVAATSQLLSLEAEPVIAAVDRLTELGRVEHSTIAGIAAVYLPEYYEAETAIAARIRAMAQCPPTPLPDAERVLQGIEAIAGITYAERQRDAIRMAAERRIMILTGGPGTGKTTVLSGILTLFSKLGRKTLLAAPTGRAAKRLSELTGRDAATVHRLLEAQVSPENGEMFFARNEDEPLECDAVIVDEMSMVDVLLMHSLLEALPQEACLVLVGDPDQLPSVGAGNLFSDLIRSGIVPSVCLTEIFRQARQSLIVMNAHAVNRGELPVLTAKDRDCFFLRRRAPAQLVQTVCELCARRLPQNMHIPAGEIQVISPTRKGETGTANLNRALQAALNPPQPGRREKLSGGSCFREGDRVMQIRNHYDLPWKRANGSSGTGVFNGDIGTIVSIDPKEDQIHVLFDDREVVYEPEMLSELELAYAITAHKSQGSEYRAVIFAIGGGSPMLLTRGVLYTAITRARELLILVGDDGIPGRMAANDRKARRYSGLRSGHGDRCRSRDLGAHRRLLSDLGSDRRDGGHPRLADRRLRHAGHVRGDLSRRHHADHRGGAASRQSDRVRTGAGHYRLYIGHRGHHRARPDRQFFRHAF